MELKIDTPPGNAHRKLRAYVTEVARLRSEGYTVVQIHRALELAGVAVGLSSVYREVWRLEKPARKVSRPAATSSPTGTAPDPPSVTGKASTPSTTSGQSIAKKKSSVDEFFDNNTHDPFLERLLERKKK